MRPVALVAVVEVLYVLYLVVADERVARCAASHRTEVVYVGERRHGRGLAAYYLLLAEGQRAVGEEGGLDVVVRSEAHGTVDSRQVEIAPVYADAVAGLCEDGLVYGTGLHILHSILYDGRRHCGLAALVNTYQRACAKIELHVMSLLVCRAHLIRYVVDGRGEQVVVVDEHRSREHYVELYRAASECIVCACGEHAHRLLLCREHRGIAESHVLEESEVGVGTTCGVVAVRGDDVLAGLEEFLQVAVEMQLHALAPSLAGVSHLGAVDVYLEHVVMRIHEVEVVLEVLCRNVNHTTHVEVGVGLAPASAHIVEVGRAESCLTVFPRAVVEAFLLPSCTGIGACVLCLPSLL